MSFLDWFTNECKQCCSHASAQFEITVPAPSTISPSRVFYEEEDAHNLDAEDIAEDIPQQGLEKRPPTTLTSGSIYDGQWLNDVNHGEGILVKSTGHRYEGQFLQGKAHGSGNFTHPNGGIHTSLHFSSQNDETLS